MWSRCYRRHVIMAFPSFDTATNSWAPQADISWPKGPARESEFVRFPFRVMSEREAVACALRNGKSWIDEHLKRPHRLARTSATTQAASHLHKALRSITPKREVSAPPPPRETPEKEFSFDEFKSALVGRGKAVSDPLLRKSYGELLKLLKSGNCSVTEIRSKVRCSHKILARSQPGPAGRQARLPLSQQEWRKIS